VAHQLYLIDGNSSLYRAFFVKDLQKFTTSKGLPTGAVYGFTNMLLKLLKERRPEFLAVAFDAGGVTARHEAFATYKANRPPTPPPLLQQIPYAYRLVKAFRILLLAEEGYEADDLLGTLAKKAAKEGFEVTLVTADKDFLQLVDPCIWVYDPIKGKRYREEEVVERYGVEPKRLPDLFALMGDPVDNIPGIPGVGEKTARALVEQFGSVEVLLDRLDEVKPEKLREVIQAYQEQIRLNKDLVTIRTDLSLPLDFDALRCQGPDESALRALLEELEFHSLLKRLKLKKTDQQELF